MKLKMVGLLKKTVSCAAMVFAVAVVPGGLAFAQMAQAGPAAQVVGARPCDLFQAATPCVAAFSTTRALYGTYTGPLYQVTRVNDNKTAEIGLTPDGYADAMPQVRFCRNTFCVISKIYDQSQNHNDLTPAPPGGAMHGLGPNGYDTPAIADALPLTVGGHRVFGVLVNPGTGYRNDAAKETAVNGQPEGVYMVTSALHLNEKCCFDFGNAEVNNLDNTAGHMDAINIMGHEHGSKGHPSQPDAGLDMEDGIYGHLAVPAGTTFVTDLGACDGQHSYAIYQGNAQSGGLTTTGVIPLPPGAYQPMKQEGAIILGIGGDNSDAATGYFFEGVMTKGMPDSAAMDAVQRNVVAAGYAGELQP